MRKKKILFAINNFNIGGPQKSLLSLLYRLDYKKYDINLIVLTGEGSLLKYLPDKVNVIPIDPIVRYATLTPDNFISNTFKVIFSKNYKFALPVFKRVFLGLIRRNMGKEKQKYWLKVRHLLPNLSDTFDVAIGVSGGTSMMYIADCVNATKRVGWIRTDYRVLRRNHEIDRQYFNKMDEIISVSKSCKTIFLNIFPETKPKIKVMYNVSPFEMYKNIDADTTSLEDTDSTKLLTIARLDPNKGLDLAVKALDILLKENYDIKWFFLGDGKYRKRLGKLIKQKGLQNNVFLLGFQFNTAAYIKECDIVVHPSRFEGKANAIDEAKYLRKPIITTNFETVKEQIKHEYTGLISEMDPKSLAEKIKVLIENKNLRDFFAKNLELEDLNDDESLRIFNGILES